MDVGGWLRGLGLGQYEEKFRDNKIDADLLPRLTVDDLKDIGVAVVGVVVAKRSVLVVVRAVWRWSVWVIMAQRRVVAKWRMTV